MPGQELNWAPGALQRALLEYYDAEAVLTVQNAALQGGHPVPWVEQWRARLAWSKAARKVADAARDIAELLADMAIQALPDDPP